MRLTKRRRTMRPEMNMTPMIDIVFLLIIFFMTVTQASEANKERLELPKQKGTLEQKPTMLTINVLEEGEMRVAGKSITMPGLLGLVDRELIRQGGDRARLSIVVRADERGTSRVPNAIMRALGKMGIARVRLAVESR